MSFLFLPMQQDQQSPRQKNPLVLLMLQQRPVATRKRKEALHRLPHRKHLQRNQETHGEPSTHHYRYNSVYHHYFYNILSPDLSSSSKNATSWLLPVSMMLRTVDWSMVKLQA